MKFQSFEEIFVSNANETIAIPCFKGSRHFIGKTQQDNLCLLIRTLSDEKIKRYSSNGKLLKIDYDVECTFRDLSSNENFTDRFSLLEYKGDFDKSNSLYNYVLSIWESLIEVLGEKPTVNELHNEVEKVRLLFLKLSKKSSKTELGLWGELFCIANSHNPTFWMKSWHINPSDTFDFNDGKNLLEVKTSLKNIREHDFSLEQLNNPRSEDLLIMSIMTLESDLGKSILDLVELIEQNIEKSTIGEFREKFLEVAGQELEEYSRKFDFVHAKKTSKFYSPNEIPSIKKENIDDRISKVRFVSNLEKVPSIDQVYFKGNRFVKDFL
jgi:hypothetical protein